MSYSLNSSKGGYIGDIQGSVIGVLTGYEEFRVALLEVS